MDVSMDEKNIMKLGTLERISLRKAVRAHPDILGHVAKPGDVNSLPKDRLVELAGVLGLDVEAVVRADAADPLMESWETVEAQELREYADRYPAFTGQLPFELRVHLFGHEVVRQARISYGHTPEGEYYDLNKNQVTLGWGSTTFKMEVLAEPGGDQYLDRKGRLRRRKGKPHWRQVDLLEDGVIPDVVVDDMFERIEEDARRQDIERREAASMAAQPAAAHSPALSWTASGEKR
jgi:hypothetical protein